MNPVINPLCLVKKIINQLLQSPSLLKDINFSLPVVDWKLKLLHFRLWKANTTSDITQCSRDKHEQDAMKLNCSVLMPCRATCGPVESRLSRWQKELPVSPRGSHGTAEQMFTDLKKEAQVSPSRLLLQLCATCIQWEPSSSFPGTRLLDSSLKNGSALISFFFF